MKRKRFDCRLLISPKSVLFLIALLNFIWFFSSSGSFEQFGTTGTKISFCLVCPWYWEWSLTSLPSLSLLASVCLLAGSLKGFIPAMLIAGYEVIAGILWFSRPDFVSGVSRRLEVYSESDINNFWSLLDVQYFFATAIFMISVFYVVKALFRSENRLALD